MTKRERESRKVVESFGLVYKSQLEESRQEGRQEGALKVIELLEKGYSLTDAKKKLKLA